MCVNNLSKVVACPGVELATSRIASQRLNQATVVHARKEEEVVDEAGWSPAFRGGWGEFKDSRTTWYRTERMCALAAGSRS